MRRGGPLTRSTGLKRTAMKRGAQGTSQNKPDCDQKDVRVQIAAVRAGEISIALAARMIGCTAGYVTGRAWREAKAAVKARDGGCVRGGCCTQHVDVHHRTPRGMGGTSNPLIYFGMANLITLCRQCHSEIERNINREEAFRDGYTVPHGTDSASIPVRVFGRGYVFLTAAGGYLQKEEDV